MSRIIAIVNQKGGVGKTTTCTNLASALAEKGKHVLVVDLDPQANATSGFGFRREEIPGGLYEVISGTKPFDEVLRSAHFDTLHILPATRDLAAATVELVNEGRREFFLTDALAPHRSTYDFVFIDCPPSLGLLTINGLVAADEVLIPVQAEYYALEGLGSLLETIDLVKANLKSDLEILGAVLTMFDRRAGLSEAVFFELYKHFPKKIFRTVIPRNTRLAEAPSHGMPINRYDQSSSGARAYERLARELLDWQPSYLVAYAHATAA